jgi:segregation and condensation protein A
LSDPAPAPQTAAAAPAAAAAAPAAAGAEALVVHLDGFEGPLDLLLDLVRREKLDLGRISILALVEQYLAVIEGARRVRLEIAAEWLVMAAWLAWLKSRLLLPPGTAEADEGELAAADLSASLAELALLRAGAAWLAARPQLGHDVFARGTPEDFTEQDRSRLLADLGGLVRAYLSGRRRGATGRSYNPTRPPLWTLQDAIARLRAMLGHGPATWSELERFVPAFQPGTRERRAARASTLLAGLELARGGVLQLRQDAPFGPILLRPVEPPAAPPAAHV